MRKSRSQQLNTNSKEQSIFTTTASLVLGLWFILFPYKAGLFNSLSFGFERPILNAALYASLVSIGLWLVIIVMRKSLGETKLMPLAAWIIPLCYWISSLGAVSKHDAKWMVFITAIAALFFAAAAFVSRQAIGQRILEWSIVGSGYIIVIYGLLNVFGIAYKKDALWEAMPGQFRLTSVLQYSNTYAALLIALFLVALYYAAHVKNRYWRSVHALMLVPIFVSFMLTLSRAALLLLPVLILCLLPFLRISKQIILLLYMIISTGASLIILSKIDSNMLEIAAQIIPSANQGNVDLFNMFDKLSWSGWLPMLGVSVIVALLSWFLHDKLELALDNKLARFNGRTISFFAVPALLIILLAIGAALVLGSGAVRSVLPPSIAERIENINFNQHSVLERSTFYKDAMKISADYPILGAGGGGWIALYQQYQNNPYSSQQTHNYFIQVLVETGWIGLLAHLILIAGILFMYIRGYIRNPEKRSSHFVLFIIALAIISHSLIDFDMSYVLMLVTFFTCLGAISAAFPNVADSSKTNNVSINSKLKLPIVLPSVMILLSIAVTIYVGQQMGARANYEQALKLAQSQKPFSEVIKPLNKAINADPNKVPYSLTAATWYMQVYQADTSHSDYLEKAGQLLDKLYKANPYDPDTLSSKIDYAKMIGQEDAVLALYEERINKFKWSIEVYGDAMDEYASSGWNIHREQPEVRDQRWTRVDELYEVVLDRIEELKKLPPEQLQGRAFEITPAIRYAMGLVAYGRGDYAGAIEWTSPVATGDLSSLSNPNVEDAVKQSILDVIRTYLAALNATGQINEDLRSILISFDPEEEQRLNELIAGRL
ncbi:O-antigen ligase family protein [Paenibacillus xylaniclasticus]|uniref:O-antigen ligase family protein n=1 Tax=Paenibacillus xylaniclasticus TaxID=588083 RepID=UPI000FDBF032|nr:MULTISPECIES: O-antigen ligase family protein [Paenibacillus]GFN32801.1 hypothetical protein PCURB6_30610 [Paenibacillus curdlanolyticus]